MTEVGLSGGKARFAGVELVSYSLLITQLSNRVAPLAEEAEPHSQRSLLLEGICRVSLITSASFPTLQGAGSSGPGITLG